MAKVGVNLVTFDGEYTSAASPYLAKADLRSLDYHTVAIIGSQSTGKSTLLNLLFGTSFDVLDVSKGRFQTTKGINMASNSKEKVIVIDIEGTDSQVRGEDGSAFEHMSALFALAVCDVLMVNMWTSEIGRYKAASVGLLKTIFEVNLKLFNESGKKRILFLLRDFNATSNNLVALKRQIGATMVEIWQTITKPPTHEMLSVSDCFEFEFFTFAPRDFQPREFQDDVLELQKRFVDSANPGFLFRDLHTDIPIDGVDTYYREIWNLIINEKDLNIPSQKEMLANLRCNEIKQEILTLFREEIQGLRSKAGRTLIPDLGAVFQSKLSLGFSAYDEKAQTYHQTIYLQIRDELSQQVVSELKEIFNQQIKLLRTESFNRFKAELTKVLVKGKPTDDFITKAGGAKEAILSYFHMVADNSRLQGFDWSIEQTVEELMESLEERIQTEIQSQKKLLEELIKKTFSGEFSGRVHKLIDLGNDDSMWTALYEQQVQVLEPLEITVSNILGGLREPEDGISAYILKLRSGCLDVIKSKVVKHNNSLVDIMTKRFNTWFQKDANGIPRNWEKTKVDEEFKSSRDDALRILDTFRYFKLVPKTDAFDGMAQTVSAEEQQFEELLTETAYNDAKELFLANAEIAYRDAVNLKEHGYARGGIPPWMWLVLLILGWNEILWLLQSPFLFYPLLFLLSLLGLTFALGMGGIPLFILRQICERVGLPRIF